MMDEKLSTTQQLAAALLSMLFIGVMIFAYLYIGNGCTEAPNQPQLQQQGKIVQSVIISEGDNAITIVRGNSEYITMMKRDPTISRLIEAMKVKGFSEILEDSSAHIFGTVNGVEFKKTYLVMEYFDNPWEDQKCYAIIIDIWEGNESHSILQEYISRGVESAGLIPQGKPIELLEVIDGIPYFTSSEMPQTWDFVGDPKLTPLDDPNQWNWGSYLICLGATEGALSVVETLTCLLFTDESEWGCLNVDGIFDFIFNGIVCGSALFG